MINVCANFPKGLSVLILKDSYVDSTLVFNNDVYYDTSYCGDWAIYYQNRYGGWDSFLIEGTVKKKEALTPHSYAKSYDNTTAQRENTKYINEIATSFECTTGWLSDEESQRLAFHLLSSPNVYLHDIVNDKLWPVDITDSSVQYKTYQNQGKKLVNYTINLKDSNSKLRQK